jgi:hypothetical protein
MPRVLEEKNYKIITSVSITSHLILLNAQIIL